MEECKCVFEAVGASSDHWTTIGVPLLAVTVGALMSYLVSRSLQKRAWDREQERQATGAKLQGRIKFHERKLGIIRETQLALTRLLEWCTHRAVNCKTGDPVAYPPTADLHQVMYGIAAIDDGFVPVAQKGIDQLDELGRKHGGNIRPTEELRDGLADVLPKLMEIVRWAADQWHIHSKQLLKLTEENE